MKLLPILILTFFMVECKDATTKSTLNVKDSTILKTSSPVSELDRSLEKLNTVMYYHEKVRDFTDSMNLMQSEGYRTHRVNPYSKKFYRYEDSANYYIKLEHNIKTN